MTCIVGNKGILAVGSWSMPFNNIMSLFQYHKGAWNPPFLVFHSCQVLLYCLIHLLFIHISNKSLTIIISLYKYCTLKYKHSCYLGYMFKVIMILNKIYYPDRVALACVVSVGTVRPVVLKLWIKAIKTVVHTAQEAWKLWKTLIPDSPKPHI